MPSSCGQPIIRSVMTTDLAPASVMNANASSVTRTSSRMSRLVLRQPAPKVGCLGVLGWYNGHCELGRRAIVRAVECDGCDGPAAKSSLGPFAQSLARPLNHAPSAALVTELS